MRMLGALVNVQFAQNGATETIVRDHALDGALDDQLGMAVATGLGRLRLVAADVAGKTHVFLLNLLLAGEDGLFGVDDNDMIAGINVGGKNGLVLAAQQYSRFLGHTAHDLVIGINNVPLAFDLLGFGAKSFHREPEIKPCRTRCVKDFLGFVSEAATIVRQ